MSKSSSTRVALFIALMAVSVPSFAATNSLNEFGNETARLATFDNAQGETSFALSLSPQLDARKQLPSDIVIFVDTSASQTGVFKKDSIATLKHLMNGLTRDDRVKLVAMDIDPVELTSGFVRVDSAEIANAITKLENRVALGSTDINAMIESTVGQFNNDSQRNRNVIYIGDGVSRDGFLNNSQFAKAVSGMTQNHISFSSYAIGPERDIELLAALANNTGGNLFIDTDDDLAMKNGAKGLAQTVHGSVFWPTKSQFSEMVNEVYPAQVPPLRTDRDTVLIGSLNGHGDIKIVIEGQINGQPIRMNWPLTTEESSIDFAFLPKLVDMAREDDGMTLPALGSAGLREIARVMSDNARELAKMGSQALANGDTESAKILAEAAIESDPNDPVAEALSQVAAKVGNNGPIKVTTEPGVGAPAIQDEEKTTEAQDQGDLILNGNKPTKQELDNLIQSGRKQSDSLILTEEDRIRVINDRFRARVQFELQRARAEMADAPGEAVDRMKSMLDVLDQTVDLSAENQVDMRARLESALMEARRRKMEFDDALALAQQNEAAALEINRTIDEYELNQAEIGSLINRFETLLKEPTVNLKQRMTNYRNAEEVAFMAFELDPEMPEAVAATEMGRIVVNQTLQWQMRRDRQTAFINSLYLAERAGVGLLKPDQPLTFPDPAEWARKVALRSKYKDVRLDGNFNDEKILKALNMPFDAEYDETPFIEVMDELRDNYQINVILDQSAKDDSLTEDDPITFKVTGIRLKNALRLMLKEKNATFIVRDETLQIISLDVASDPEYFVTNVYNVGDLVAPRTNFGGMMGGGMGGGGMGGGGMGGMGGGGMG
ncbi:MAG: VWA domain-containing protein, partial [Mariniblastus sp.]|nr:VWA domain-containing protein [Mariniblastus sp.]